MQLGTILLRQFLQLRQKGDVPEVKKMTCLCSSKIYIHEHIWQSYIPLTPNTKVLHKNESTSQSSLDDGIMWSFPKEK